MTYSAKNEGFKFRRYHELGVRLQKFGGQYIRPSSPGDEKRPWYTKNRIDTLRRPITGDPLFYDPHGHPDTRSFFPQRIVELLRIRDGLVPAVPMKLGKGRRINELWDIWLPSNGPVLGYCAEHSKMYAHVHPLICNEAVGFTIDIVPSSFAVEGAPIDYEHWEYSDPVFLDSYSKIEDMCDAAEDIINKYLTEYRQCLEVKK